MLAPGVKNPSTGLGLLILSCRRLIGYAKIPLPPSRVARSLQIFSRTFFSMKYGQWREEVW